MGGVTAGLRAAALLAVGQGLWVLFGAVRGAADWQVSGGGFVVGLLVAGLAFGCCAPRDDPRHLLTGGLLVLPGGATLVAAGPGAHGGVAWWFLTLIVGLLGAAAAQRLVVELRRALAAWVRRRRSAPGGTGTRRALRAYGARRPPHPPRSALADGPHNR